MKRPRRGYQAVWLLRGKRYRNRTNCGHLSFGADLDDNPTNRRR